MRNTEVTLCDRRPTLAVRLWSAVTSDEGVTSPLSGARSGFFVFPLVLGLVSIVLGALAPAGFAQAAPASVASSLLAQVEDPYADPEAVQERLETGSPEETVLHDRNKRIFGVFIVIVALAIVGSLIWAFRAGRQNRPVSGKPKGPPSRG